MDHSKVGSPTRGRFIGHIEWRNERMAIGDKLTTRDWTAGEETAYRLTASCLFPAL